LQTYHLHINGIVQGVGFRPAVHQLATEMQLQGIVKNGNDGLHIIFNASKPEAELLLSRVLQRPPANAEIRSWELREVPVQVFANFSIVVTEDASKKDVLISPDVALCGQCKVELQDRHNRRYRYPFITCAQCGPRYSIMKRLPYERHHSTMQPFVMCDPCSLEYHDVQDRRFFSQTNSCGDCGIELRLYSDEHSLVLRQASPILAELKACFEKGKIIAVKGIGGYLLLCRADSPETIQRLRKRKNRPNKPFAVLFPGIGMVIDHFSVNANERVLLESRPCPIVLLRPKEMQPAQLAVSQVAPGLNRLGVMLPCSPLLELISNDYGKPLIATSANISGSPIIYRDEEALACLFDFADAVVTYNRDIVVPQDDSVVQSSPQSHQSIFMRRSRGYAPSFLSYTPVSDQCMLATGAFLKSSFTLSVNGNAFVSQFLGSGESYESQEMYKATVQHFLNLYDARPRVFLADKHPDYFSHCYAKELATSFQADIQFIQHHEAHFAAVLAENDLLHGAQPVLGVVWDGTGWGDDGHIWGGEFFTYENNAMLRCYHFDYFPWIAGEKTALEPRIAALCVTSDSWPHAAPLKAKFSPAEWNNYQALIHSTALFTSSVGRIFDAVASLLDVCDKQTYEGEAAMYLQALAEEYVEENGFAMAGSYFQPEAHYYRIPTASLLQGILMDLQHSVPRKYIAAKFHYSLVCLVGTVAKNTGTERICFTGGVFQNALLVDWIHYRYDREYTLYFHQHLPPNDENISLGQLVYFEHKITTQEKEVPRGASHNNCQAGAATNVHSSF